MDSVVVRVQKSNKRQRIAAPGKHFDGFTIVELLVVVVIIAILAAITIIAYNGIQNRANDSAVQSDLANMAKQAQLFRHTAAIERYPQIGELSQLSVKATKNAYHKSYHNLYYCTDATSQDKYAFAARSSSGTIFYVSSSGRGTIAGSAINGTVTCNTIGVTYPGAGSLLTTGYNYSTDTWNPWVQ